MGGALFPYPFGSTSKGFAFINSLTWTLDRFITLPVNASQGSIIDADGILYLVGHSFILGIIGMVYCTFSKV